LNFFEKVRKARAKYTGPESVATLDYMEDFLNGGVNWTQGEYNAANGARCMVGAADAARVSKIDDAKFWLRQAIAEREPHLKTIEEFNDSRQSYAEIEAVIRRAKELAHGAPLMRDVTPRPVATLPVPVTGEILPPDRPAPAPVMRDVTPRPAQRPAPRPINPGLFGGFFRGD
jgi:hypothetical protein